MRTILFLIICCISLQFCNVNAEQKERKTVAIRSSVTDSVNYASQIQPVLQQKCSPCHFTGGKMYERMPFDKGETIVSHETGIVTRLSKETGLVTLIKQYVMQTKSKEL